MARYVIDAPTLVRLAVEDAEVAGEHRLVAPNVLRSQALALVYRSVRAGEMDDGVARAVLDRVTTIKVRLLGDRVSRSVAWSIAVEQGWDEIGDAEYLAVTRLQADALVAGDAGLAARAADVVPVAAYEDLLGSAAG